MMMWYLFGRAAAVAGLAGYLFFLSGNTNLSGATYTPWLFPGSFMQAFFYMGVAGTYYLFKRDRGILSWVFVGVLVGLCFLGHAAPALILVVMITGLTLQNVARSYRSDDRGPALQCFLRLAACGTAALGISLLILLPIFTHYRFHVINPYPATWLNPEFKQILQGTAPKIGIFGALIGLFFLVRERSNAARNWLIFLWIGSAFIFFVWAVIDSVAVHYHRPPPLPLLVPAGHFYVYLTAAQSVLFGFGLARFSEWLHSVATLHSSSRLYKQRDFAIIAPFTLLAVLIVLVVPAAFHYDQRWAFLEARNKALALGEQQERVSLYNWIRNRTESNDVFLVSGSLAITLITPAARKLVVTERYFSNPYVDWDARNADQNQLLDSIRKQDASMFSKLARRYSLRYLLVSESEGLREKIQSAGFGDEVLEQGSLTLFRVVPR
jgi:hypothetical protein